MFCLNLIDLPLPASEKTGWPWTKESQFLPNIMYDGCPWPRISIITPSYNQAGFLEKTIRSVLLQGYPNLEYMIIDGGSKDGSVEIIKRYENNLAYWVSEPDRGQSHAINKGVKRATGEFIAWLNSDDFYLPGALMKIAQIFKRFPKVGFVSGICEYIDPSDHVISRCQKRTTKNLIGSRDIIWRRAGISQPATFIRSDLLQNLGLLNEDLHYAMDFDLWCRLAERAPGFFLPKLLARATFHPSCKTFSKAESFLPESIEIMNRYKNKYHGISYLMHCYYVSRYRASEQCDAIFAAFLKGDTEAYERLTKNFIFRFPGALFSAKGRRFLIKHYLRHFLRYYYKNILL